MTMLRQIVLGRLASVKAHPNADKLRVCAVELEDGLSSIVCGAPNVREGMFVAVAKPGSILDIPDLESQKPQSLEYAKLKIKVSKIRGEVSNGMICSLQELGYVDKDHTAHDGIWELPTEMVQERNLSVGKPIPEDLIDPKFKTVSQFRTEFENQVVPMWDKLSSLKEIAALLSWDQQVVMPSSGSARRASQVAALTEVVQSLETSPDYANYLKNQATNPGLNRFEKTSIQRALKENTRASVIDAKLISELKRLESVCTERWAKARTVNKFQIVQPVLKDLVQVVRECAMQQNKKFGKSEPYDVLVDTYSIGFDTKRLNSVFSSIRENVVPIVSDSKSPFVTSTNDILTDTITPFELQKQEELSKSVVSAIVGDKRMGSITISKSHHPFATGISHASDIRFTSRFSAMSLKDGLMGSIHEMGHSMYELGLPDAQPAYPASKALDIATHESQSLFWERMIGQGKPFWQWITPLMMRNFGYGRFASMSPEEFTQNAYESVNLVDRSNFIRVQADELHYPLHVMIRFFIEQDLINGKLDVANLQERWNSDYTTYLGITPRNDSEGCMQDIHWYCGAFGYFPSYTLGAIASVQFYNQMKIEMKEELDVLVSSGNFEPIVSWLQKNIHSHGAMDETLDGMLQRVTSKPLDVEQYVQYLKTKYS